MNQVLVLKGRLLQSSVKGPTRGPRPRAGAVFRRASGCRGGLRSAGEDQAAEVDVGAGGARKGRRQTRWGRRMRPVVVAGGGGGLEEAIRSGPGLQAVSRTIRVARHSLIWPPLQGAKRVRHLLHQRVRQTQVPGALHRAVPASQCHLRRHTGAEPASRHPRALLVGPLGPVERDRDPGLRRSRPFSPSSPSSPCSWSTRSASLTASSSPASARVHAGHHLRRRQNSWVQRPWS